LRKKQETVYQMRTEETSRRGGVHEKTQWVGGRERNRRREVSGLWGVELRRRHRLKKGGTPTELKEKKKVIVGTFNTKHR